MSDDLEYLARREREREQAEKEALQAATEERWRKEGPDGLSPADLMGYHDWKQRTGYKEPSVAAPGLIIVLVVVGLFIFAVVFGPCS